MTTSLRQKFGNARTKLHERLSRTANCYDGPDDTAPAPVQLRIAPRLESVGALPNGSQAYAERWQDNPKLIFLRADTPARGSIYVVEPGMAYQVDSVEPADGVTVTAYATRLTETQAAGFDALDA